MPRSTSASTMGSRATSSSSRRCSSRGSSRGCGDPTPLAVYLSLMIAYGVGNMANDAWYEQVVKRGWTSWRIPSVLQPGLTWMWGLLIVAGAAIFFTAFQPRRDHAATHRPSSET